MISFFSVMIYITTIIAFIVTIIFYGAIVLESNGVMDTEVFTNCNGQLKICKITSVVFAALYWFCVSGQSKTQCLAGYAKLAKAGTVLGCIWIILGLLSIVLSIGLSLAKRDKAELTIMGKLRASSFVMGAIFLLISFVLKVN